MHLSITRNAADFVPYTNGLASTGISLTVLGHDVTVDIRGVPHNDLDKIEAVEIAAQERLMAAATQVQTVPEAIRSSMFQVLVAQL